MSSGFITEKELEERRQVRQKEWERVRKPDQPVDAPERQYDSKSLYERLQEQKQKKDFEYDEAHRFKNLVKRLDEDDIEFLQLVDENKLKKEREKILEEKRELEEFRTRVAQEMEKTVTPDQIITNIIPQPTRISSPIKKVLKQQEIVKKSIVVRKRKQDEFDSDLNQNNKQPAITEMKVLHKGALKCVGILPGIGSYYDTDSSDSYSSDDDDDSSTDVFDDNINQYDMLGRVIEKDKDSED